MGSQNSLHNRLQAFVSRQPGLEKALVENLHKMPGGASKEMWGFDLRRGEETSPLPMVVRYDRAFPLPVSIGLKEEFLLLREVHKHSVPVPTPYGYSEQDGGPPFYVIERVKGETIVRRLHRDPQYEKARNLMTDQLGRILARIHCIPTPQDKLPFLPHRSSPGRSPATAEVDFYEEVFRKFSPEPHPALELALRWLKQNAPQSTESVLVHGDYRLGNVMFTEEGVRSILDWELAHIGDPMEDVGYISVQAWRFGNSSRPIGGIGERDEFYEAYEKAGGFPLDLERIFFWEVFGNLKWAVITILQMLPFLTGSSTSIELASLGRITAEVELELMHLLEQGSCKTYLRQKNS